MDSVEKWSDVIGYEGLYVISNHGRLAKVISPADNGQGYCHVGLTKDGVRKDAYVHRLVAEAYCSHPEGCDYINHINHNRSDNRAENLERVTQRENVRLSSYLMRHEKAVGAKPKSTGEKYVHYSVRCPVNPYVVVIRRLKKWKCFPSLEAAVRYRDEVLLHGR